MCPHLTQYSVAMLSPDHREGGKEGGRERKKKREKELGREGRKEDRYTAIPIQQELNQYFHSPYWDHRAVVV